MARVEWRPPIAPRETHASRLPAMLALGDVPGIVARPARAGGGLFPRPLMPRFNWADTKRTAATASLVSPVNSAAGVAGLVKGGRTPPAHLWPPAASPRWTV